MYLPWYLDIINIYRHFISFFIFTPHNQLPNNNLLNPRPPRFRRLNLNTRLQLSSPRPNIHIRQLHKPRPMPQLIDHDEQNKHRKEDIINHKVRCTERIQKCRVSLEEDEEDVSC